MFHSAQIVIFHSLYNYSVLLSTDGNVSFFVQLQCSTQYSWWCFILSTVTMFYSVQIQCFTQYSYNVLLSTDDDVSLPVAAPCGWQPTILTWGTASTSAAADDAWSGMQSNVVLTGKERKSGPLTEWDEEWMTDPLRWRVDDWPDEIVGRVDD